MSPKVFNAVDDSVHSTESTDDSNLLIGKVSDHLKVQTEKTHHKFASGVIDPFLDFIHLLLRTQSIP
jgi:hypothetical protein